MQAITRTPFELFGNQVRYVVPLFQRPYVWNQEDQWQPLWEDLRNVADQLLESQEQTVPPHFLGAIVLDQQWGPAGYITHRHIVDGQQRLTTLQLVLDAAQAVLQHFGDEKDASALGGLILNNPAIAESPDDVYKVWPTNYDRAAFRAAMDDGVVVNKELAKRPIAKAHAFFEQAISEWAEVEGDPDKTRLRLGALTRVLLQHLKLVVIDLEEGDNAQVIFETLNYRGTPLLAADLVKNRVFQVAQATGLDVEKLYEEKWKPFDSGRWRKSIRRGRLRRPRIDVFLYYWLAMKKQRVIAEDRLFAEFDGLIKLEGDVENLVDEFVESADVYERLEQFDPYSPEGTFTYRVLDVLEAHLWGPVLLWLFGWSQEELPLEQRRRALEALESWLVRRAVCRMTGKQANRMMSELLIRLDAEGPAQAGDVTVAFLRESTGESEVWPSDGTFRDALLENPLYRQLKRARLRMILEAIEDSMRTDKTEDAHCQRGRLTIEHVMPQGWREHWSVEGTEQLLELAEARRDHVIHTLGNLTLVTKKLNPALSNRPWTDGEAAARELGQEGKRSILDRHTVLHLNKGIVRDYEKTWNEETIASRGQRLADLCIEIWPSPIAMQ